MLGHSPLSGAPLSTSTAPVSESHALISFIEISSAASPNGTALLVGILASSGAGTLVAAVTASATATVAGASATSGQNSGSAAGGATTATPDAYFANVSLLLHGDGTNGSNTFVDSSSFKRTPTLVGAPTISTAQSKFNGASMSFGTSAISFADSADWFIGTGDFTAEGWVRFTTTPATTQRVWGQREVAGINTSAELLSFSPGKVQGFSGANSVASTTTLGTEAWYSMAYVANGASEFLFIGGKLEATAARSTGGNTDCAAKFSLGRSGDYTGDYFGGFIDEFRFTKGVARYTANYVPQDRPFSGDDGAATVSSVGAIVATAGSNATIAITGVEATSGVGAPAAKGNATKLLVGAASTSGASAIAAVGTAPNANVTLTGAAATSGIGATTADGTGVASPAGAQASASVGAMVASASGSGNAITFLTGAGATSASSTATATGGATYTVVGAAASASVGAPVAANTEFAILAGTASGAQIGALTANGSASKTLTGAGTTSGIGTLTASGTGLGTAFCTGVGVTSGVGAITGVGTAQITLASDGDFAKVALLLHAEGVHNATATVDSSSYNRTATFNGNAKISNVQSALGDTSFGFDGFGDFISFPDSADFIIGNSSATIEARIFLNAVGTFMTVWGQSPSTNGTHNNALFVDAAGKLVANHRYANDTAVATVTSATALTINTWYHVAVCIDTFYQKLTIRINGTSDAFVGIGTATFSDTASPFCLGRSGDYDGFYLNGYVDEFRFTKGLDRYDYNQTIPNAPFAGIVGMAGTSATGALAPYTFTDATATFAGAPSTSAIAALSATGSASAAATGAGASSGVGAENATGSAFKTLTGAAAASATGTVSGAVGATIAGAGATSGTGATVANGTAFAAAQGIQVIALAGTLAASGTVPNANVTLVGASAVSAASALAPSANATKAILSVQVTSGFGLLTANGGAGAVIAGALIASNQGLMSAFGSGFAGLTGAQVLAYAGIPTGDGGEARPRDPARIYLVQAELRIESVPADPRGEAAADQRGTAIPPEPRIETIVAEPRGFSVEADNRTFTIEASARQLETTA